MSRDSKFTPGPWVAEETDSCGYHGGLEITSKSMPYWVAKVQFPDGNKEIGQANARLIAAAPELYEALQDFTAAMRKDTTDNRPDLLALINALHKADAALRKAEGKGDEHE